MKYKKCLIFLAPPPVPDEAKAYTEELIRILDLTSADEAQKRPGSQATTARKRPRFDVVEMASKRQVSKSPDSNKKTVDRKNNNLNP